MKHQYTVVLEALKLVFNRKYYLLGLGLMSILTFMLFVMIPVLLIPGNDITFQLSIMPVGDFVVLIVLSILTAISILFSLYIVRRKKEEQVNQVGVVTATGGISIISSFLGTVTCISCASTIIGFAGVGTVTFALKYRFLPASISLLLMLVSLYFNSKKILYLCDSCHVQNHRL